MTRTKAMVDSLLSTKLYAPSSRDLVLRGELMRRLEAGTRGPLTVIVAPAGCGKTTLLGAWRALRPKGSDSVAWLALDAADNDIARFLRYLVAAVRGAAPSVGARVLSLVQSPPLPPVEALLTPLINDLDALSDDVTLVLDDYHVIDSASIHQALDFLLQHLPPHAHMVVASRADPPLPLARLRARGHLVELREADLRFSQAEAADFLRRVMGLRLSLDQIALLEARTEGWIAGLQLAALSLRAIQSANDEAQTASDNADDAAQFIAAFTGSHRYIVDYMVEEVLGRESADIQRFLLHTSLLERMCADLCEAVALDHNSQAVLDYLERANLFLIPLDAERRWYRYHHLFASVLRRRLGQSEPDLVTPLHRRASEWYEQHQFVSDAVHHALQARDFERAADLVEAHATEIGLRRGEIGTILTWLDALPASLRRTRPLLGVQHAALLLLLGECETARQAIEDAEAALAARIPALAHRDRDSIERDSLYLASAEKEMPHELRPVLGRLASLQAILALYAGDLGRVDTLSQRAVELVPEADPIWHARAQLNSIWSHRLTGDAGPATENRMMAVVTAVRRSGQTYYPELATINLAHLYVLQGRMRRAVTTYEQALHALERGVSHTIVEMYGHLGLGEISYEWNDLDLADHRLSEGVRMLRERQGAHAEWSTAGYLALVRVQAARGEHATASATLDAFIDLAKRRGFVPELIERAMALKARHELRQGDLDAALRWVRDVAEPPDGSAWPFRREQVFLTWARVQIARITQQRAERGDGMADAAHHVRSSLDRLLRAAQANGRMHRVVEVLILRALAAHAAGDVRDALTSLRHALALAEPEGYVRVFIDEGAPMSSMLQVVQAHAGAADAYLTKLLTACAPASPPPPQSVNQSTLDPLSERELEILALLAAGLSTEEIAGTLVIAAGTVKNHLKHIFAKLGVHSRLQAVERARARKLV